MSNNQTSKTIAVFALAALLMTFVTAGSIGTVDAQGNSGKDNKADKGKQDKAQKKQKGIQQVRITANVDASQVANATDAFSEYSFTVQSGAFVSKAKQVENPDVNATEATLNFNGKLKVSQADGFTVTAISEDDSYQTVVGVGSFSEQAQGQSGKTVLVGNLNESIVLQETAEPEIEELS